MGLQCIRYQPLLENLSESSNVLLANMWRTLRTKNGTIIYMEIVTLLWPSVHSYLTDMEFDMHSLTLGSTMTTTY
jgi:hypothetical protein